MWGLTSVFTVDVETKASQCGKKRLRVGKKIAKAKHEECVEILY